VLERVYEIKGVACGSCRVCVLGNSSLSKRLSEDFPDWKPGTVTQITLRGAVGQTTLDIECSYSPIDRVCRKRIMVLGDEENLIMGKILSLLDELSKRRKGRKGGAREDARQR
jgi:hypothetical protein